MVKNPKALILDFFNRRETRNPRALPLVFGATHSGSPNGKKQNPPVLEMRVAVSDTKKDGSALASINTSQKTAKNQDVVIKPLSRVSGCLKGETAFLPRIFRVNGFLWGAFLRRQTCASPTTSAFPVLKQSQGVNVGIMNRHQTCAPHTASITRFLSGCLNGLIGLQTLFKRGLNGVYSGTHRAICQRYAYTKARKIPCDFYPVIETDTQPETDKNKNPRELALPFTRRKRRFHPKNIPLPFGQKADIVAPPLDTYIMLNTITATCGDITLNPLSASVKTDMNGYCWQGEIALSPDDFGALNLMNTPLGQEKIITLTINGDTFRFMAENISDHRAFGQRSYTVSGRSLTAKLGADYAICKTGFIGQDLYASQLVQSAIADTGFTLEWQTVDWLIPANTYTLADKTPIAVIMDIAHAVGAFVVSHPAQNILYVRPKYKLPAWQLKSATADFSVPANMILSVSGQKHTQTQANGVFVLGEGENAVGAHIVRTGTDALPETDALSHCVYTDLIACEAAGIAALSDTGNHKTETVTLPIMKKYQLPLASLGQIWRFTEPSAAFIGIIESISIKVGIENQAPKITQQIAVNCFFG